MGDKSPQNKNKKKPSAKAKAKAAGGIAPPSVKPAR